MQRLLLNIGMLCFLSLSFLVEGRVREISSISEALNHINKKTIVFSGTENTQMHPNTVGKTKDQYGSEQWGAARVHYLMEEEGLSFEEAVEKVKREYADYMINKMVPELVEPQTKEVLDKIREESVGLYTLTSRRKAFKEATHRHFKQLGIKMSGPYEEFSLDDTVDHATAESDDNVPFYSNGVIFARVNKPEAVMRFLQLKYGTVPTDKTIVFIDDKESTVNKFVDGCKKYGVQVIGLRYSACDEHVKKLIPSGKLP